MKPLAFSRLEAARKKLLGLTPNPGFEKAICVACFPIDKTISFR